jgi:hypothetical protein
MSENGKGRQLAKQILGVEFDSILRDIDSVALKDRDIEDILREEVLGHIIGNYLYIEGIKDVEKQ